MMKYSERASSFLGRELISKPENQSMLFVFLLLFNLVFVGYFGIFRGYKNYLAKKELIAEFEQLNTQLEANIENIKNFTPYTSTNKGVEAINDAIPIAADNSQFLKDITRVYSRNGFILESLQIADATKNFAQTGSVTSVGLFEDIPDLIQDIEAMDRLTKVQTVVVSPETSTDSNRMKFLLTFDIYNLPR